MLNRLEMLRIFLAAAEANSFKEAAARLGISPQAVTRAVHDLEEIQGELLFHRSTRNVRITAFGEALAARARPRVGQLDELFQHGTERVDAELRGVVRLTAPVSYGRIRLMPVLTAIASRHPHIQFDLRFSDTHSDVVDEKIDIGVRFGFLHDNRFVARQTASEPFHVVAAPALLARVGIPTVVTQLNELPTSVFMDGSTGRPWPWFFAGGQQMTPARPRFLCADPETEREFVLSGLGFAQIPGYLIDADLAAGRMISVLRDVAPDPWDIYVYRPQRGPVPARIRMVYDELIGALGAGEAGVR